MENQKEMLKLTTVTTAHQEIIDIIKTAFDFEKGKFRFMNAVWNKYCTNAEPPKERIQVPTYVQEVCNNAEVVLAKLKELLSLADINTAVVKEKILQPLTNSFHNLFTEQEVKFYGLPPRQRVFFNKPRVNNN